MLTSFGRHVRQQFVGYLALFIALGGVSYAAVTLPRNSVGTAQIKRGAVKNSDLGKNAVKSSKVKDGSLLSKDFKPGQLVAGAPGAPGLKGDKGDPGTNGTDGTNGLITSATVQRTTGAALADGAVQSVTVSCPAGQKAIAGGVRADDSDIGYVVSTRPVVGNIGLPNDGETFDGWRAIVENPTGGAASITPNYWVVCAS